MHFINSGITIIYIGNVENGKFEAVGSVEYQNGNRYEGTLKVCGKKI